jgi:hypothetical protein
LLLSLNVKLKFIDVVGKIIVKIGHGAPLQFNSISELDVVREFTKEEILQVKVDVQQQQLFLKLQMNKKFPNTYQQIHGPLSN